jgi:lipopolysaccharide export system permease protein
MNQVLINYLLKNFFKAFLIIVLLFYSFGIILNLFEEIEFFKNTNVNFLMPLMLTVLYIPSLIIKILPFIIFISSMWFMIKIRNNKDLLILKVFGYSNIKIFFILALASFVMGWLILFFANPITSSMSKYYETTKSKYSRDIDHLVSFNRNGLWIKENIKLGKRIISADKPEGLYIVDVTIFHLDNNYSLIEKITADKAYIKDYKWVLSNVKIYKPIEGLMKKELFNEYILNSIYNHEKINNLFKSFETMSFYDILTNYKKLIANGYNKTFLDQNLHSMLSMPFFLLLMTGLASIMTMYTLKNSNNFKIITLGLLIVVIVFYFKDLSLALGQTDRIPLILGVWAPVIALSFFTFIGLLQINEK